MAKERSGGKSGGVSFRKKDAVNVGLFSSGPAKIKEACFTEYTYRGQTKPVNVLLVTYTRKGEEPYEQPYGIGRGWKIKNGELVATAGQTGLPTTCNAMKYLVEALETALPKAGLDPDEYLGDGFPGTLEGLDVVVARVDQEKRSFKNKKGKDSDDGDPKTILTIEAIGDEVPDADDDDEKPKRKSARERVAEDDEDDEEDDKPRGKSKGKSRDDDDDDSDDDDEDDDEKPARGKGGKKPSRTDDDDDDDKDGDNDDDDLFEEGVEALISALEDESPIKVKDLADVLDTKLKGNKRRKDIIKHMTDPDVLGNEKGWTFNERKGTITLDND